MESGESFAQAAGLSDSNADHCHKLVAEKDDIPYRAAHANVSAVGFNTRAQASAQL